MCGLEYRRNNGTRMHKRGSVRMTDKSLLTLFRIVLPGLALALALTGYFLNEKEWWRWAVIADWSALLLSLGWLATLPFTPTKGRWSLLRTICVGVWLLFGAILMLHYLSEGQAAPTYADAGKFGLLVAVGLGIRGWLEVRFEPVRTSELEAVPSHHGCDRI